MGVGDWPVGILCPGVPVKERTRKEKDVSPFLSTLSSAFSGSAISCSCFTTYTCRVGTRLCMRMVLFLCAPRFLPQDAENTLPPQRVPLLFFFPIS